MTNTKIGPHKIDLPYAVDELRRFLAIDSTPLTSLASARLPAAERTAPTHFLLWKHEPSELPALESSVRAWVSRLHDTGDRRLLLLMEGYSDDKQEMKRSDQLRTNAINGTAADFKLYSKAIDNNFANASVACALNGDTHVGFARSFREIKKDYPNFEFVVRTVDSTDPAMSRKIIAEGESIVAGTNAFRETLMSTPATIRESFPVRGQLLHEMEKIYVVLTQYNIELVHVRNSIMTEKISSYRTSSPWNSVPALVFLGAGGHAEVARHGAQIYGATHEYIGLRPEFLRVVPDSTYRSFPLGPYHYHWMFRHREGPALREVFYDYLFDMLLSTSAVTQILGSDRGKNSVPPFMRDMNAIQFVTSRIGAMLDGEIKQRIISSWADRALVDQRPISLTSLFGEIAFSTIFLELGLTPYLGSKPTLMDRLASSALVFFSKREWGPLEAGELVNSFFFKHLHSSNSKA